MKTNACAHVRVCMHAQVLTQLCTRIIMKVKRLGRQVMLWCCITSCYSDVAQPAATWTATADACARPPDPATSNTPDPPCLFGLQHHFGIQIALVQLKCVLKRCMACGSSCAACGKVVTRPDGLLSHGLARADHANLPSGAIRHREYARLLCCGHETRLHTAFICELSSASHGRWSCSLPP